jgi:hypothetical protein
MYGLVIDGEPFQLFARREGSGADTLVLKFECKDGMGVLGIRKVGRTDPPPAVVYEESDIDAASLRAGRFVHVLSTGQRQSYALSRISPEFAARLPADRWVELKPHTEYGFRYLVAPEDQLDPAGGPVATIAAVQVGAPTASEPRDPAKPAPTARVGSGSSEINPSLARTPEPAQARAASGRDSAPPAPSGPLPPPQTPMAPPIAAAALGSMQRDQAVEHLRNEMSKVHVLQTRISDLEEQLKRSRARERDLLELLARWQG